MGKDIHMTGKVKCVKVTGPYFDDDWKLSEDTRKAFEEVVICLIENDVRTRKDWLIDALYARLGGVPMTLGQYMSQCGCVGPVGDCPCIRREKEMQKPDSPRSKAMKRLKELRS